MMAFAIFSLSSANKAFQACCFCYFCTLPRRISHREMNNDGTLVITVITQCRMLFHFQPSPVLCLGHTSLYKQEGQFRAGTLSMVNTLV